MDTDLLRALVALPVPATEGVHLVQLLEPVTDAPGLWWVAVFVKEADRTEPVTVYGLIHSDTWATLPEVSAAVVDLAVMGAEIEREVFGSPNESEKDNEG